MKLKIAVVDDETPICEWLVYCIQRLPEKHQLITAANGNEALDLILAEQPDLVFTDIRMPGIDGLELMKQVKEVLPSVIFVILSNYAEFTYARKALAMGARDYVLKSELRSADISAIINKVSEERARSASANKDEIFPSGCIDLNSLYSAANNTAHISSFWLKHGMKEYQPFLILCFSSGKTPEDWNHMIQTASALRDKYSPNLYSAVASQTGLDYLILQSDRDLNEIALYTSEKVLYRGAVGISDTFDRITDIPNALKQAALARTANFFFSDDDIVLYSSLVNRKKLDQDELLEEKRHLLDLISQRKFTQAQNETVNWFSQISEPSPDDLSWAVDSCRRMVLSIEERYYQMQSLPAPAIEAFPSLKKCEEHCVKMLKALHQMYNGKCSAPVSAALEYIHDHYAEQISMAEVAQQVYWSPEYFSRQFKEEVGENFNTYLTLYRLDRARELLNHSDLKIWKVAEMVGYPTPGYFSRIYKRYKGITPEQERESKDR